MGLSTSSDEIEDVPVPPQEAASLEEIAAAYPYAHNPAPERRCTCTPCWNCDGEGWPNCHICNGTGRHLRQVGCPEHDTAPPERRCTCFLGHDLATATSSRNKCPEHGRPADNRHPDSEGRRA